MSIKKSHKIKTLSTSANQIDAIEAKNPWWKKLFYKTRKVLNKKNVRDRLEKVEKALELNYLDKPQAEANKMQAEAASALIKSLVSSDNACIQVGSLLLVKVTKDGNSSIFCRTLTIKELKVIEENQRILQKPEKILAFLKSCDSS